jgi:hypothetical protein
MDGTRPGTGELKEGPWRMIPADRYCCSGAGRGQGLLGGQGNLPMVTTGKKLASAPAAGGLMGRGTPGDCPDGLCLKWRVTTGKKTERVDRAPWFVDPAWGPKKKSKD